MRRKISIQMIVTIAIVIVLSHLILESYGAYRGIIDFRQYVINYQTKYINGILVQDKESPIPLEYLIVNLQTLKDGRFIDFFQIENEDQVIHHSNNIESISTKISTTAEFVEFQNVIYKKIKLTNFSVVFGLYSLSSNFFDHYFAALNEMKTTAIIDIVLLILVVAVTVLSRLQILSTISNTLAQIRPQELEKLNHPSQEIKTIVNFLKSYIAEHFKTESEKNIFKQNIADGIIAELFHSNKKPPYPIQAIVVRLDMNNYTRQALQNNTQELTQLLSKYFNGVKELRTRYGAYDYQFIGDEKVMYFKLASDEKTNPRQADAKSSFETNDLNEADLSVLKAFAFLRDCFLLADSMGTKFPLTFKSAIVPGKLTFFELDGGHYFTGAPLIESARYLSTISEKEKSIISVPSELDNLLKILSVCRNQESILLKGYTEPVKISYYEASDSHFIFGKIPELYLSDRGLVEIMRELEKILELPSRQQDFFEIFKHLRKLSTNEIANSVTEEYERLLSLAINHLSPIEYDNKILSAVISLAWAFIPPGFENGKIKELLYTLIRHKDPRVASNALMASQRFEWNEQVLVKMLSSPSNRLRGDALVLLGRKGVDDKFYKAWKDLIENKDQNFILSGLWASEEVFKFHLENNPAHLKSNPLVDRMIAKIKLIYSESQGQVRARASLALSRV